LREDRVRLPAEFDQLGFGLALASDNLGFHAKWWPRRGRAIHGNVTLKLRNQRKRYPPACLLFSVFSGRFSAAPAGARSVQPEPGGAIERSQPLPHPSALVRTLAPSESAQPLASALLHATGLSACQ
jgi:hypothetical protein